MKKLNGNEIIYSLNLYDIQLVALEEIGKPLSQMQIESIKEDIAANINWYDAIAMAISKKFQ